MASTRATTAQVYRTVSGQPQGPGIIFPCDVDVDIGDHPWTHLFRFGIEADVRDDCPSPPDGIAMGSNRDLLQCPSGSGILYDVFVVADTQIGKPTQERFALAARRNLAGGSMPLPAAFNTQVSQPQ